MRLAIPHGIEGTREGPSDYVARPGEPLVEMSVDVGKTRPDHDVLQSGLGKLGRRTGRRQDSGNKAVGDDDIGLNQAFVHGRLITTDGNGWKRRVAQHEAACIGWRDE